MVKFLDNSRKRPINTEAAKYQRGEQKCSKPKVIRKLSILYIEWDRLTSTLCKYSDSAKFSIF